MAGVRLEFAQFGHFEYFNIYRNSVSTAIENLGQPIGISSTMYYEDLTVEPNRDYYYRAGAIRDSAEEFSEEIHTRTEVVFDPPYDLVIEFKDDEINRLELNWKLDGFVNEQRYYCSETPIDTENLPTAKAVLAGDVRTYTDTVIDTGKTYYVGIGSVKNGVEKLSAVMHVSTGDAYFNDVDLLIVADTEANSYIDHSINARSITKRGSMWLEMYGGKKCIRFDGYASQPANNSVNGCLISAISALNTRDYTIEIVAAYPAAQVGGARLWEIGTENANRTAILPAVTGYNGELLLNNSVKASYSNIYFDGVLRNHTLMRKDGVTAYYVDGIKIAQTTDAINISADTITIGAALVFNGPLQGWMHALRITNAARYNAAGFTPESEFQKF